MFRDRIAIAILLVPVALWVIHLGGWVYAAAVIFIFALAGREYAQLYRRGGFRPSLPVLVGGIVALLLLRQVSEFRDIVPALGVIAVLASFWHMIAYERGWATAGTDFAITLSGLVYIGLMGGFLISLRQLPDGEWWTLMVVSGVWLADTGAYSIGGAFGKHKMAPRLSPKKSWEGYAGSVVVGAVSVALFSVFWHIGAGPDSAVTPANGALMGGLLGLITPVGDLAISMMKRQFAVKDTGALLAGHGGALDRTDSWMVGALVGYLFALWLMR